MANETADTKADKMDKARRANEGRNKERLKMLEAIADGSDEAHASEMQDTDGTLIIKNADNTLELSDDNRDNVSDETNSDETQETVSAESDQEATEQTASGDDTTSASGEETQDYQGVTDPEQHTDVDALPPDERLVNGVKYYLTIVNGKELWLTKSQLVEKAQKVASADEYLHNASEAARTVSRSDPSEQDDAGTVEEVDWEKTLSSAVMGEQEAVQKIASAFSSLQKELKEAKKSQPSVTPDVVKEIDSRLAFRSAVEWFNGEFSKELSDPFLKKLIYDKDSELAQANPEMPYKERLKKAGDEVRSWINSQKGVQAKPSEKKLERKKTLVNVPNASTRQAAPQEDEEEDDVESAIQAMAKARGQNRAIVHRGPSHK